MKHQISTIIISFFLNSLSFAQVQPNEVHQIAEPNATITAANFNVDMNKMAHNPFYNNQLINSDWTYFTAKYEADIKVESQELSGSVSFRMKKDSIIWFSVSAVMGIQILKGIITQDSAHILDVYNQKYYGLSILDLNRMQELPANISAIQALIIGNSPTTDIILKDSILTNNEYTHNWVGNNALFNNFSASSKNKIFTESRFADKGKMRKLVIGYTDRQLIENIAIPRKMSWSIIEQKSDLNNLRLDLTLKTARFDAIPSYPFSIPADYERVPIQKN